MDSSGSPDSILDLKKKRRAEEVSDLCPVEYTLKLSPCSSESPTRLKQVLWVKRCRVTVCLNRPFGQYT